MLINYQDSISEPILAFTINLLIIGQYLIDD